MQKKHFLYFTVFGVVSTLIFCLYSFTSPKKHTEAINTDFNAASFTFPNIEDSTKAFPAVLVKNKSGVSSPIQLEELKVNVQVIGNISTTTLEMLFYNDSNRVLEGELYFPLNEGQSVSRFALDINGKLREGVIVEKNKGQAVFESVIRQKVDPGLLEWTAGNNFKARIYPIPSKGHKRMIVAYEEELTASNEAFIYQLPLNFKERIKQFDLKVEVVNQQIKPIVNKHENINFKFKKWNENYVAETTKQNFLSNGNLGIALPIPSKHRQIYTEKIAGTENSYYYYAILPAQQKSALKTQRNSIDLIWDASGSSSGRDLEKELKLLEQYFQQNSSLKVQLYVLRNALEKEKTYSIANGDWNALKSTLSSIPADGASAYRGIDYSQFKSEAIFLFGDGISNFGKRLDFQGTKPIYTVSSSLSSEHSYLKYLSMRTGGASINLITETLAESLPLLTGKTYCYLGNSGTEAYPSIPTPISENVAVVGIIHGKTQLSFNFGYDQTLASDTYEINPEDYLSETGLIRRIWAQKKLTELDINSKGNEGAITALGKEFGIVTRNTSLIVLDRVEDYVEHEITPPAELREKYTSLLAAKKATITKEDTDHLAKVKNDFDQYVAWWKKDFDLTAILLEDKKREEMANNQDIIEIQELSDGVANYSWEAESVVEEVEMEGSAAYSVNFNAVSSPNFEADLDEVDVVNEKKDKNVGKKGKIKLEKWEPNAAYFKTLKSVSSQQLYAEYLKLKAANENSPSYYLDVADLLIEKGKKKLALRVLSNIAELELENHELLRVLAHRLEQLNYYDLAIASYRDVLKLRKEEPQSYRDLALCLDKNGAHQEAVDLLYKIVNGTWDTRFPGIETIALTEINRIISLNEKTIDASSISKNFIQATPVDVRVIVNWDSDNCDMDLWVTDPREEKCFYSNNRTKIGGHITNDFTGGYGPEVFDIKKALKGNYKVQIDYYGTRSQKVKTQTTVQVQLITNYGKSNESVKEITRRLSTAKEVIDIGSLIFE